MNAKWLLVLFAPIVLASCATRTTQVGTLAELSVAEPDLDDVQLEDGLERAAQSYRRYLEETSESERTPEAMRRLADLQIEQAYGVLGTGTPLEMAAPEMARPSAAIETARAHKPAAAPANPDETDLEFEARATGRDEFLERSEVPDDDLLSVDGEPIPVGPREAIATYQEILEKYPNYERNDRVLYQMSRAYDEIGEPDQAMEVMNRFVSEHPYSRYADEVHFRRGEYYFVRKKWLDAEAAYSSVSRIGSTSSFYELALYKLGWTLYKQFLYEEALHQFMAVLDYQLTVGYDFDQLDEEDEEHRVIDTFRVVSLSFSNLGGPEVIDDYFSVFGHRTYADNVYSNLAEFYFEKLRYDDAASVYKSFIKLNPFHAAAPHFSMRVVDVYDAAGFPLLVVESKKEFATRYAVDSNYWNYFDPAESPDVIGFLKTNLTDLAGHYHSLYQAEALADDLYAMKDFPLAIESARKLIANYPESESGLLRAAWAVVAHSSIDIVEYADAEFAYSNLLALTPDDDAARQGVVDGLAAAIYKQAEQANLVEDYRAAADHFLRIKSVAPDSTIRSAAEYDAGAALMRLEDWSAAAGVLEEFRSTHPDHELSTDATKQLAYVYREAGEIARSAEEHERIAAESEDPDLRRDALLTAGELYDEAEVMDEAVRVYEQYVLEFPRPIDIAMETHARLADIFKDRLDYTRYHERLRLMVAFDGEAGADRSDRTRFLASGAALVLAELTFERFATLQLTQPFEESLAEKQTRMDQTLSEMEGLVNYEVADVTAAATFYIAQVYDEFSRALLESERPAGLSEAEKIDYELVIEEEAYPFEEQAIDVHQKNHELLASGIYNPWVQKSLDRLAVLMPGRYAKNETSEGFVRSISYYAYRMPIAPEPAIDDMTDGDSAPEATASVPE